eukprot:3155448-Amphidinium_carterae.1
MTQHVNHVEVGRADVPNHVGASPSTMGSESLGSPVVQGVVVGQVVAPPTSAAIVPRNLFGSNVVVQAVADDADA